MSLSSIPRWKKTLDRSIAEFKYQTVFQLATLDPTSAIPHVRSHIFRSFLHSPSAPTRPLLISSTDIRTPKVTQLATHPDVELAWWIEGTKQQYRIAGKAFLVSSPKHSLYKHFIDVLHAVPLESGSGLAVIDKEEFDWEAKRLEVFRAMSSHMKASWCRPTPGSKMDSPDEAKKWPSSVKEPKEGDSEEVKNNWEWAFGNFALLIIDPYEVDFVDMGVVPNERTKFYRTTQGGWEEVYVVP